MHKNYKMSRKVDIVQLINSFNIKHNSFYDYSKFEYVTMKTKATIICPIHGEFQQTPDNHKKSGCPLCGAEKVEKAKKKDTEYFLQKIKDVHGDTYKVLDLEGKKSIDKVIAVCKEHGNFSITVSDLTSGRGCSKCAIQRRSSVRRNSLHKIYEGFKTIHGDNYDYPEIVDYKNGNQLISIYCKRHNSFFNQSISSHLAGHGCPKCGLERSNSHKNDTQETFLEKALKCDNTDNLTFDKVVYKATKEKITVTCNTHGDFDLIPNNFLMGQRCPKCNNQTSKAEKEIVEFLKQYVEVEESNRTVLNGKELDIFIPTKKIAVEFNGLYWHSDKFVSDNYHKDKTDVCEAQGIKLIQIFEDEWRDKKEIVKSRLLNIIGKTPNKIFARNCKLKEVSSKEASKFLEENHIQGKVGAKIKLGLYHNGELVSLMTFGNLRKALGSKGNETDFELLRFCNLKDKTVVGGASKLLKYFKNNYNWNTIISYADRRWSQGDLYRSLKFDFLGETKPNYFYTKGTIRENRFNYRKSELVKQGHNKEKTEKQIMNELGYVRIFDSGTLKFKIWQ